MNTPTDIANYALGPVLGAGRVTSLDDATEEAAACKQWYPAALDGVVKAGRFSATIKHAALVPFGTPIPGFAYSYQQPADWLQTVGIDGHQYDADFPPWRIEGGLIHSNIAQLTIAYKFRPTNIGGLPNSLSLAIGAQLGAMIALQVTGDAQKKIMAEQLAAAAFAAAQAEANGQQPRKTASRPWSAPRRGFGGSL